MSDDRPSMRLIYDGDCPFCRRYAHWVRLREAAGEIALVDARADPELAQNYRRRGYDLDKGMVLEIGDRIYHGAEVLHRIALMTSRSGLFNRLTAWIFKSERRSRWLYPILRAGRNAVLRLLGKRKIHASQG